MCVEIAIAKTGKGSKCQGHSLVMKTFLTVGFICSVLVQQTEAQEQRVTAKIKKQNAEHNAAIEKGTAPSSEAPAKPAAAAAKKDPLGDVATAEKAVKYQLNVIKQAKLRADQATKNRDTLHATYKNKNLDPETYAAVMKRYDAADKEIATSHQSFVTAKQAFEILYEKYQKLGGTTDYRSLVPQ